MCEICGKWDCPPHCPNYREGEAVRCGICGGRLQEGDVFYQMNGKPYCEGCVLESDLEELVRICEAYDAEELLCKLGLSRGAMGA